MTSDNHLTPRKILVTSALPYANGSIHLGHMVEHIQADIWVRFQKMLGHDCLFICGDDAHGTPIMISAEKKGMTPEAMIAEVQREHMADFQDFQIAFDHYYTTHSSENKSLSADIYKRLQAKGDIETRTIEQSYDPVKHIFLPDRYVKGDCPRCGASDQYGDNCEACGATYDPTELKNPISVLSGVAPEQKTSLHYFFLLQNYEEMLKKWISSNHLQEQVKNKLNEWFQAGLQSWDISRDAPYFGFEIPDAPGKYFYVWLDAPIGYMASLQKYCEQNPAVSFDDYWRSDSEAELYHFIGKDIIYFHALFWPAILEGAGFRKPTAVFAHGFLTVNGEKMSKSRGTFITARDYLKHLNPEYLRYYFAARLSGSVEDIDLNFSDFTQRINSDLVGKVVNIASRCAGFITKLFEGKLSETLPELDLYQAFVAAGDKIASHYEKREYHQAVRDIMLLADRANQYIDAQKPWHLAKQPDTLTSVQGICTQGINLFKLLITYLKPILPSMAKDSETFLNVPPLDWNSLSSPLLSHEVAAFLPLMQRVDVDAINAMLGQKDA
jgi:methionyl-tRNA synthetase